MDIRRYIRSIFKLREVRTTLPSMFHPSSNRYLNWPNANGEATAVPTPHHVNCVTQGAYSDVAGASVTATNLHIGRFIEFFGPNRIAGGISVG